MFGFSLVFAPHLIINKIDNLLLWELFVSEYMLYSNKLDYFDYVFPLVIQNIFARTSVSR